MQIQREGVAETFGDVLRELRTERRLTQAELAERSNLHDTYISLLERGRRQPSLDALLRLAKALEVTGARMVEVTERRLSAE